MENRNIWDETMKKNVSPKVLRRSSTKPTSVRKSYYKAIFPSSYIWWHCILTCLTFIFYSVICCSLMTNLLQWLVYLLSFYFLYNLLFLSYPPDDFWIVCLYIAIDIDATGLDAEENDIPANHRSPKPSANSVTSPHSKEKRMPFFKKVTQISRLLLSTCSAALRHSSSPVGCLCPLTSQ